MMMNPKINMIYITCDDGTVYGHVYTPKVDVLRHASINYDPPRPNGGWEYMRTYYRVSTPSLIRAFLAAMKLAENLANRG